MDEAGTHETPAGRVVDPDESAEAGLATGPVTEPVTEAEIVTDGSGSGAGIPPAASAVDYDDAGVPTFDYVRDRVEGRVATSIGAAELPEDTRQAASLDEQLAERDRAGRDRLEQIRRSMG